jgi:hypothetical protein
MPAEPNHVTYQPHVGGGTLTVGQAQAIVKLRGLTQYDRNHHGRAPDGQQHHGERQGL